MFCSNNSSVSSSIVISLSFMMICSILLLKIRLIPLIPEIRQNFRSEKNVKKHAILYAQIYNHNDTSIDELNWIVNISKNCPILFIRIFGNESITNDELLPFYHHIETDENLSNIKREVLFFYEALNDFYYSTKSEWFLRIPSTVKFSPQKINKYIVNLAKLSKEVTDLTIYGDLYKEKSKDEYLNDVSGWVISRGTVEFLLKSNNYHANTTKSNIGEFIKYARDTKNINSNVDSIEFYGSALNIRSREIIKSNFSDIDQCESIKKYKYGLLKDVVFFNSPEFDINFSNDRVIIQKLHNHTSICRN